jgi:hypothetical protein
VMEPSFAARGSLPEGRSLALRERERCERSGERSSSRPDEPIAGGEARS